MNLEEAVAARVEQAIAGRVFPGCVVGWFRDGTRIIMPFGALTYDSDAPIVVEDTVYDVASITKSIPTASLALECIAKNTFSLSDTIHSYIPELHNDFGATIEDLLRYRVHGPQLSSLAHMSVDEIERYVFEHGFKRPPGESVYTNLPALLLGIVIERVTGQTLDVLAKEQLFGPFHMDSTGFPGSVLKIPIDTVAPTEIEDDGTEIRAIPHDESARVCAAEGRAVGHAGLFSTAPDLLLFLEALLDGRLPRVVEGAEAGLGWQVNDARFMGICSGATTFGKTGFTGTSIVADRPAGVAFVLLSNRTYPKRPASDEVIYSVRKDIAELILEAH